MYPMDCQISPYGSCYEEGPGCLIGIYFLWQTCVSIVCGCDNDMEEESLQYVSRITEVCVCLSPQCDIGGCVKHSF